MNKITNKQCKYKFLYLLLALVFAFCALSACTLVDDAGNNSGAENELTLKGDYLVGMMLYIERFDEDTGDYACFPTDDLNSDDAIYMYEYKYYEGTMIVNSFACQGSFFDSKIRIGNNGAVPNGTVEIEATFYYTYELLGEILRLAPIYQTGNYSYYSDAGGVGYHLNEYGISEASYAETMTASRTNIDGTKEEISYTGKVSLKKEMIDYLINARILEFDKDNFLIKTTAINLASEDFYHTASENCEYIILEKDFEVMHESDMTLKQNGDKYTERTLMTKTEYSYAASVTSETLPVPQGNGFVRDLYVRVEFDEQNSGIII